MTREEEINNAIIDLSIGDYNEDDPLDCDEYDGNDLQDAFIKGAKWADENPKYSWISVKDDLPCNHEEMIINADSLNPITKKVLIYNKNKEIRVSWMLYLKDKGWVWDISAYSQPLFFMFIPELPKE